MSNQNEISTKESSKSNFLEIHLMKKTIIGAVIILVIAVAAIGLREINQFEGKTTKIGFEDIGELVTQSAYCTEINVTEDSRKLFGLTIPFTQSKYIYSYDVIIKAGLDFKKIEWSEKDNRIEVRLPEVKVLSNEIDMDSFKVYHEDESIFAKITLSENNEAMKNLKQTAEKNAIANGLLENAISNAKTLLTGFFGNVYNLEEYEITFIDKE
ncbi:MAG: DUF4230 domain-containing protein [Candidatus Fimimorpha sp.]